ncbi:MAG: hypothetical protein V4484_14345 [Pseudomonadota bacterium]
MDEIDTSTRAWSGDIGCEGGPVLVANLDDFQRWHGSDPLDRASATELHYWSQFTAELPEQWHPNGRAGHQYLATADPSACRDALMSMLVERWPGTTVDRSNGSWRATLPDGRLLHAALSPDSEYERAIRDLGSEAIHHFGSSAMGYLWSAAPGVVRITLAEQRDLLLLSQVEYADDDVDEQAAHAHALTADLSQAAPGIQYRVTCGPVVVAWSPNSVRDLSRPIDSADTGPSAPGLLLDMATDGSGALLWLAPGLYRSTLQYHEQDSWAVSCCRLQRVDDLKENP